MLAQVPRVKADRMVISYVARAIDCPPSRLVPAKAAALVHGVAKAKGGDTIQLDHAIWRFESGRIALSNSLPPTLANVGRSDHRNRQHLPHRLAHAETPAQRAKGRGGSQRRGPKSYSGRTWHPRDAASRSMAVAVSSMGCGSANRPGRGWVECWS